MRAKFHAKLCSSVILRENLATSKALVARDKVICVGKCASGLSAAKEVAMDVV